MSGQPLVASFDCRALGVAHALTNSQENNPRLTKHASDQRPLNLQPCRPLSHVTTPIYSAPAGACAGSCALSTTLTQLSFLALNKW